MSTVPPRAARAAGAALGALTAVVLMLGSHTSPAGPGATEVSPPISPPIGATREPSGAPPDPGTRSGGRSGPGTSRAVADGRATRVPVRRYPSGHGRDLAINGYALPILVEQTLDTQSADVDMVSGATATWDGYRRSLQAALDGAWL